MGDASELLESTSEADDWWEENCSIIPPEFFRLVLVGVVGACIASVSVFFNTFLFCVLCRNRRHRHSHLIYLMFLALADTFLSGAYILLFPVNLYMDYFNSEWLAAAWWTYMRVMITVSHVFISTSAFLICAAAFERYMTTSKLACQFARHHRLIICLCSLVVAVVAKLPMYFEVEVVPNGNCTGVTSLTAIQSKASESEPYKTAYKYWFRNVVTIFLPFVMCFYLNFAIIRRLRIQHKGAKLFRFATSEHRTSLLLEYRTFYTLSSDLVSLLTVCASACRLPIYLACNARIRCEVLDYLETCVFIHFDVKSYSRSSTMKSRARATTVRYCDTGNGYMIYDSPNKKGERRARSVGTGLDRIVLSVAMGSMPNRHVIAVPPTFEESG
ncbi:unnamed protein product [Caenorhabditis auriculariae]|uniref:G-protein coupled receptors family 1 profile domain-containing protein n=1 Tax=Caenorhabditis auriculariae TaxID=2777116 RepID=A0A8S1H973_9PELO|nr:unnamed protein product [Caenorhabditis auriculariae]